MDKKRPRSSRIRLVRYIPETSPTSSIHSGFEPGMRCKSCGGFHALKPGLSSPVERLVCSCSRCEIYIKEVRPRSSSNSLSSDSDYNSKCGCDKCRDIENRRIRPREPRPISPTSSDSSGYERTAGARDRHPARRAGSSPLAEKPREAPSAPMTPALSAKPTSTRPSITTMHAAPIIHHHCSQAAPMIHYHSSQAAYCMEHPELCRVMPSPIPLPAPPRTQPQQSHPRSRQGSPDQPNPRQLKCTCGSPASETFSSRYGTPRTWTRFQHCGCGSTAEQYIFDGGDTASDSSVHAMAGDDHDDIESHCPLHHRCRPRFEAEHGWVCGRK
ncbi:hypothetical protein MYU51_013355 [Penicillium brevicompactum]|uniref:uncharacterized protein n=1 Tax=Penicillium brevicompactum TaxID=5074 RepID=UPI00254191CA|nr:uncharacterized protein N7506_012068 [Penicillium brevicompactum]KAJ5319364.1 hypothetical protein N7506_012068 [Penicillium brevicompactum]